MSRSIHLSHQQQILEEGMVPTTSASPESHPYHRRRLSRQCTRLIRFLSLAIMPCAELYYHTLASSVSTTTQAAGALARVCDARSPEITGRVCSRPPARHTALPLSPARLLRCGKGRASGWSDASREQLASLARTTQACEKRQPCYAVA